MKIDRTLKTPMDRSTILTWLLETDEGELERLWAEADRIRRVHVGEEVHLRGLIEISNYCIRQCKYCGIRVNNTHVSRYRMEKAEILECALQAEAFGYGTVVLQSGEDAAIGREWITGLIEDIKSRTKLAVTLSLGERPDDDYIAWHQAGVDRYLLRFETSNPELFRNIHPSLPGSSSDRIAIVKRLKEIGYEAGSGVMIGIPGQTYADLAEDIILFRDLELDMVGVGPFIPHPETPLGKPLKKSPSPVPDTEVDRSPLLSFSNESVASLRPGADEVYTQAPNTELMTYKVVALTRLNCPDVNIPSTTALATLNKESGRELGLMRGANVLMPNTTPTKYREKYEIYPSKACLFESSEECRSCMSLRICSIGRTPGKGRGDSKTKL